MIIAKSAYQIPDDIGVKDLRQSMPVLWSEQKKLLNMK